MQLHDARVTLICDTCHVRIVTTKMRPDGSLTQRSKTSMERAVDKHKLGAGNHEIRAKIEAVA